MIPVAVATVGCVEACLAGDYLFVLLIVHRIKTVAHIQEPELLQMDAVMFYVQELIVEQFVMVILVTASNFKGVR